MLGAKAGTAEQAEACHSVLERQSRSHAFHFAQLESFQGNQSLLSASLDLSRFSISAMKSLVTRYWSGVTCTVNRSCQADRFSRVKTSAAVWPRKFNAAAFFCIESFVHIPLEAPSSQRHAQLIQASNFIRGC